MTKTNADSLPADGLTGIVLTGGKSRRMGVNKALLLRGGKSYAEIAVSTLSQLCRHVLLVGGTDPALRVPGASFVPDEIPDLGPLGGIVTAFDNVGTDRILVMPCDLPQMTLPILTALVMGARNDAEVILSDLSTGLQPLVGVYSRSLSSRLRSYLAEGKRSVKGFLDHCQVDMVRLDMFSTDDLARAFTNVNTPGLYEAQT